MRNAAENKVASKIASGLMLSVDPSQAKPGVGHFAVNAHIGALVRHVGLGQRKEGIRAPTGGVIGRDDTKIAAVFVLKHRGPMAAFAAVLIAVYAALAAAKGAVTTAVHGAHRQAIDASHIGNRVVDSGVWNV